MRITITKKKEYNKFNLTFKDFTAGMILSMKNALNAYSSPVGKDVLDFLNSAIQKNEELSNLLK